MPPFATDRLVIRRFFHEDWRDLQEYAALREVTRYDFDYPQDDEGCQQVADYFAGNEDFWAVCLKTSGKCIGHVVLSLKEPAGDGCWSLGYIFNPKYYGQGYATEACRRLLQYVFEDRQAHRVEAGCCTENAPSWKLLERLSMRREAHHLKNAGIKRTPEGKPIWWDSYIYAMLEEDWFAKKGAA